MAGEHPNRTAAINALPKIGADDLIGLRRPCPRLGPISGRSRGKGSGFGAGGSNFATFKMSSAASQRPDAPADPRRPGTRHR